MGVIVPALLELERELDELEADLDDLDEDIERVLRRQRLEEDRQWVRETAPCPTCKAKVGENCRGRKKPLITNHTARNELAVDPRWKPIPRG